MTPQLDADDRARAVSLRVDALARREPRVQVPAVVSSSEMPAALPIDLTSVQATLVDALVDRKLLVCVGPRISQEAGLPGPDGLLDLCRQQLAADGQSVDGLSERSGVAAALEWAQVRLRPVVFRRVVREALMQSVAIPATVQALLAVSPGLNNIVTTNLDRLIERAFAGRWPVVDADAPDIARRTRMILKICGTVERPDGWVLTAGQWENAALTAGTPRSEIEALLRNYVVLFVGFAPGDEVFERVLDLRRHVVADERPASATLHPDVALVPAGLRPHERARLEGRGIEAVELAGDYGADAAAYLRNLGEALARRLDRPAPTSSLDVEAAPNTENPYPGLAEFTRVDRRYFFGRDDDIARTLGLLRAAGPARRRWLFLHGPSGIGKSSYLHAGLLPALEEDGGAALGANIEWRTVVMHPGRAPVFSLSAELCGSLAADAPSSAAAELGAQILARPAALGEFIDTHLADDQGLLLVVDQLEQALLLPDAALREPFAAALADVLVRPGRPVLLVTSMRSDFVGDLPRLPALLEVTRSVDPTQRRVEYLLAALRTEQLAEAIEGPAREARVELEPGLTRRVLEDAGQLVGGDGLIGSAPESTLPLVAAILAGLYERRRGGRVLTHAAYDELGGVAGALSRRADAAMQPLIAEFTETTLWALIRRLVGLSPQGRATRQSLARAEALAAAGGGLNAEHLLARLADASTRLVVLHGAGEDLRVELVHDALLHGWTWLRARLERERSDLLREAELTQAAARWDRLGRPAEGLASGKEAEDFLRAATPPDSLARRYQSALSAQMQALRAAERRRRLAARAVMAILAIGLVTIAVLFVDASRQTRRAEQQTRRVRDAAVLAAAQRALATDAYAAAQLLREIHEPDGLTGWTEAAIAALHRPGLPQRFPGHTGEVHAIEFSGDGEWLATASEDRTARLIPLAGGEPIVFRHEASVRDVTIGTKGESLVTIADKVQLWWRGRPNSPLELFAPADPSRVAFSPEGAFVAITGRDGARIWRADGVGEPFVFTCPAGQDLPDGAPAPIAWHPRSLAIALACRGRVVVWRFAEPRSTQTIDGLEQPTLDLRFDDEGKRLALLDRRHAVSYSLDGPPDAAPTPRPRRPRRSRSPTMAAPSRPSPRRARPATSRAPAYCGSGSTSAARATRCSSPTAATC